MRFGLLVNKWCRNLGDDIQSYAQAQFLPQVDYLVDRETIDTFTSEGHEKVAAIMGAWWMGRRWRFPPSDDVWPLLTSMHINTETLKFNGGTVTRGPLADEHLTGIGGDYFKAYGPVGTRDMHSLALLKKHGIDAYFSGCTTLTLPKQKRLDIQREYACLVDLPPEVEKKAKKLLIQAGLEVKVMTHQRATRRTEEEASDWHFRAREVEELLTAYQNAKCVITRRLHVSLPCLAMEVPVLCVHDKEDQRFEPYNEWLHMVSPQEFLAGDYDYNFQNPKPNKTTYLEKRRELCERMSTFVAEAAAVTSPASKTTYTEQEKHDWQYALMREALDKWTVLSRRIAGQEYRMDRDLQKLRAENKRLTTQLSKEHRRIKKLLDDQRATNFWSWLPWLRKNG